MDLIDFKKQCAAGSNVAGTGQEILFAPLSYFVTIEKPVVFSAATTPDELVKITGSHVFDTGKGFHKMPIIQSSGKVESKKVGPVGGSSFEHSFGAIVGGDDETNMGLNTLQASCDWIFLVPVVTSEGTVYKQIGSEQVPAYCEQSDFTTGQAAADLKGTTVLFKSDRSAAHVPSYLGTVTFYP